MRSLRNRGFLVLLLASGLSAAPSAPDGKLPRKLAGVGLDDRSGTVLPADLSFRDVHGSNVALSSLFVDGKPLLLVMAYFNCPVLCGVVQSSLVKGINETSLVPGSDFQMATVSMDPRDTSEMAFRYRTNYVGRLAKASDRSAIWSFLTGSSNEIGRLAGSLGFRFRFDSESGEFLHPAAVFVLSPGRKLCRVLTGVSYSGTDLRLALAEAKEGRSVTLGEHLLLFCYQYDPAREGYSLRAMNLMRAAGVATVLLLIAMFFFLKRREHST